jgi:hypothetical protein
MTSREPTGIADLQVISEYLTEDEVHTNGGVHLQYLAVEEEPLVTNTYVAATPDCIRKDYNNVEN